MIEDLCGNGHIGDAGRVTQDGDNVIICYTYPEKRLKE